MEILVSLVLKPAESEREREKEREMECLFRRSSSFGKMKLDPSPYPPQKRCLSRNAAFSYQKFIQFALEETQLHTQLIPSPLQEHYRHLKAIDGKTKLQTLAFQSSKIRLYRGLIIEGDNAMQVLDFALFPEPEYDVPIFCASFFTASNTNVVVLDLNPLHDVIDTEDYKAKYYKNLMPLGQKYAELLPWGSKITGESLGFFSPIVIWSKFCSDQHLHDILFAAFKEYFKAWLQLMDQAKVETNASQLHRNCEAQHKYLIWRAEKDPGHQLLKKLLGESLAQDLVWNFLFNGVNTLGSKSFLDYFPEYRCVDGSISKKRSIIGKSFENRPWDAKGNFIGANIR
ncbi:phytochromobilin:ferredoxin oxidoreductase, chloroplastic isoform X2 [Amborella trichopoda]|uniref:phytochromobilin:ferredoxin oxidoreductase, chloroplastic isoform X2 n=1 Tax=Amborella trichopoda TaxID=13333 RepID=UPI0009C0940E|nr:phytochromobilin:ferredoxin oxidoreductase, chloroplastic isoform X2 [Amborella trichopoda]|eukprot:XP_011622958.2 phytochromobilin:ferredoxin oxidoreductase, chloroplastic isoform X2 [Amborella trichopoda]